MSSKERVFNFTEDIQTKVVDYKNRNKKRDVTDFMSKRYEVSTAEVKK